MCIRDRFPAVIAALGILSLVGLSATTLHDLTHGIGKALPTGTSRVFQEAVTAATSRSGGSVTALVVGVLVALWSASSGMAVLQQGLDIAYGVRTDKSYVARRLWSFPLMALVSIVGGCAGALIVFGQPIGAALEGASPVHGAAYVDAWTVVRWVVTIVLLSLTFSVLYYFGPNRRFPRWRWVTPGSALATAVFLLASLGFSFYVSSFGSYSKTYGSFAGVAILVFWFWLVGLAILVGAELNAELDRALADPAGGQQAPAAPTSRGELAGTAR